MNNVTTSYNIVDNSENLYLHFRFGESKYAVNVKHVVEIMKLPLLDYPQRLANNVVGLLNYNNFTINILDLRFYLNTKVTPYSKTNQLLIVNTDETIFGLIIDKVEDITALDQTKVEYLPSKTEDKIIEFIYKKDAETISVINLVTLENIIRKGVPSSDIDITSLFPTDDDSKYELTQRNLALQSKFSTDLSTNFYAQDKFISFSLNDNVYCITLEYVKEFLKGANITKIPCNTDYMVGVTVLRGDFINIIDIKKFLEINSGEEQKNTQNNVIVIEVGEYKVGFLVDEIFNIINIPEESIQANSQTQDKFILSEVILENKLYTILNVKNILADEKFFIDEGG